MPGTLIRPAHSIGDAVWIFELGGWLKATIIDDSEAVEIGTYRVKILGEADEVAVTHCGGPHILKRLSTKQHAHDSHQTFMDDMPGIECTNRAIEFLESGMNDIVSNKKPTYKRGDAVWLYRRGRHRMWVTATVVDVRFV